MILSVSVEPNGNYKKAELNVIQAMQSMQKLTFQQRYLLAREIFGVEAVTDLQSFIQRRWW